MKGIKNLLVGFTLGILIGWALGFLRLPFIEKNFSFLIGFIACLALGLLALVLIYVWNKNALILKLLGKYSSTKNSVNATKTYTMVWILVAFFIVLGGVANILIIFKQNKFFKTQTQIQNKKITEQSELIVSISKSNQVFLMSNILDKVDDELKNNPNGKMSDATIARIAALGYSFKPYRYLEGDSLSDNKLSPERGQLLLALSIMNIDSSSFDKIKLKTSFSGADLSKADLKEIDLTEADLKGADLTEADLKKVILKRADLTKAKLWAANLNKADLSETNMRRADLSWADMSGADLNNANFRGAILTSAIFKNTDLSGAYFRWADLNGVLLNEANLTDVDMAAAFLRKANLSKTNLSGVNLTSADLRETNLRETNLKGADLRFAQLTNADLTGAQLNGAIIEEDWFKKLDQWKVIGAIEIQTRYKIIEGSSPQSEYRLVLNEH